jgi:hypothetical protein
MRKKPETKVRVWHPGYQAFAYPVKKDLAKWEAAGWTPAPEIPDQPKTDKKD